MYNQLLQPRVENADLTGVLAKDLNKMSGTFFIHKQEIIEKTTEGDPYAYASKIVSYKLFGVIPIYKSIVLVQ